jgi:serine/threonine-protein kinase
VGADGSTRPLGDTPRTYRYPRFSPDGRRVAVTVEEERTDIYIVDVERGSLRKLTDTGSNTQPTWLPDSRHVTFASRRRGSNGWDVYTMPVDGSAEAERLIMAPFGQFPTSWARRGDVLASYELNNETARDLWTWSRPDRRARAEVATEANERGGTFSPDGRWLAYVSNESGRDEVYLRRHPGPGGQEVISSGGGTEPVWGPGGDQIFYRSGGSLVAVPVREGKVTGPSRVVLTGPYVASPTETGLPNYDVAPDGRTFVMVRSEGAAEMRLRTVQNWFTELRRQTARQP